MYSDWDYDAHNRCLLRHRKSKRRKNVNLAGYKSSQVHELHIKTSPPIPSFYQGVGGEVKLYLILISKCYIRVDIYCDFDPLPTVIVESAFPISEFSVFSTSRLRSNSRITSVAGLPVRVQYCSSFFISSVVRFTVSRLTAHFFFIILFYFEYVAFSRNHHVITITPVVHSLHHGLYESNVFHYFLLT